MEEQDFLEQIRGKELHWRLRSNDLLEKGKTSLTVVGTGVTEEALLRDSVLEEKSYTEYAPQTLLEKFRDRISGKGLRDQKDPGVVVIVEEKRGRVSADDVRYVEWLGHVKGERPRVAVLPEFRQEQGAGQTASRRLLSAQEERKLHSFWARQLRRLRALPAPVTKDAALAAIPRTFIPVAFILFLAYVKRNEVLSQRVGAYIGLTFGFSIGFALLNQTVLNWITFWSEFTRDAFEPRIRALDRWISGQAEALNGRLRAGSRIRRPLLKSGVAAATRFMHLLSFISARGDVLIGGPLLGVGCTYLARVVLGPVGETVSVLTLRGFLLVLFNVLVGCVAGGPYTQVIAHLRAVGKISNKASMYLGIVETVKMELGRVADFGMQTLYNAIQATLAIVFWLVLLVVDRCYRKPEMYCLQRKQEIDSARALLQKLRAREDVRQALAGTRPAGPASRRGTPYPGEDARRGPSAPKGDPGPVEDRVARDPVAV